MSNAEMSLLLVEDEALLHEILIEGLGDAGFQVILKNNGAAAQAELDADASRFRAVITDIQLGDGLSGWEIGRRARELVPDIPVIYMSGDSAIDWGARGVPGSVMIKKPFVIAQMVTALANLLNQGGS